MPLPTVNNLFVGEVGSPRNANIRSSVSTMKLSFSSDGVSQLDFSVVDKDYKMWAANFFEIRRPVYYITPGNKAGTEYEISAVTLRGDPSKGESIDVTCRTMSIQKMKRDKGAADFGAIAPTSFAAQMAAKYGLKFFGEASAPKDAITRTHNERTDESSWDVLRRLAGDLEFELFEADNVLYFSSAKFLVQEQPQVRFLWPPNENHDFPIRQLDIRASDDDPLGARLSADVDRINGVKLRPGMRIVPGGVGKWSGQRFMCSGVDWDEGSHTPVKVTAILAGDPVL